MPCSGEAMQNKTKLLNQFKQSPDIKLLRIPSVKQDDEGCADNDGKEQYWGKTCDESGKSLHANSKVNENTHSAGPLRYAIHLRFICPSPKNTTRLVSKCRSNSLPEHAGLDMERERRFYLYNDLRVVFPQRHSDADEGKVCMYFCCSFWRKLRKAI